MHRLFASFLLLSCCMAGPLLAQDTVSILLETGEAFNAVILEEDKKHLRFYLVGESPEESKKLRKSMISQQSSGAKTASELEGERLRADCKMEQNEVDEFRGTHNVATEKINLTNYTLEGLKVRFRSVDDTYLVELRLEKSSRLSSMVAEAGEPVMFKLENDSVVEGRLTGPGVRSIGGGYFEGQYRLSKEALKAIAQSPIRKVRIYFTNSHHEEAVVPGRSMKASEAARCLLAY